jgi:hypothetical protein
MAENLTANETSFVAALHDLLDDDTGAVRAPKLFTRVLLERGMRVMMAAIGAGPVQVLTTITVDDITEEVVERVVSRVLSRAGMKPEMRDFYARMAATAAVRYAVRQRAARS